MPIGLHDVRLRFKKKESRHSNTLTLKSLLLFYRYFFSLLVMTSHGAGVSSSKFARNLLLGLLYLPIPTRAGFKSTRPYIVFSPKLFESNMFLFTTFNLLAYLPSMVYIIPYSVKKISPRRVFGYNSLPWLLIDTRIGGNASYKPPGAP